MARIAEADRPVINFDELPEAEEVARPTVAAQTVDDLPAVVRKVVTRSYESSKAIRQPGFGTIDQAAEFARLCKLYGKLSANTDKPLSVGASVVTDNDQIAVTLFARDRISRPRKAAEGAFAFGNGAEVVPGTPTTRPVKAVK